MRGVHKPAALPAVGTLLNLPAYIRLREAYSHGLVADALREQLGSERAGGPIAEHERLAAVEQRLQAWTQPRLRPVINGTGVILHTNLGRAPLSVAAARAVADVSARYNNLELDLETGKRGERAELVAGMLGRLLGAESALVVNNNAAAVLLALTTLCRGREVIVSRGQQVEIGGSFRMPDVMRLSGARMVEVGTTNRTRIDDYGLAIGPRTAALLRVHPSNFRITGFVEAPSLHELSTLARDRGLLLIDDIGSGALTSMGDEPTVGESVQLSDVATFSGDKLLGGPQAGIVVGGREHVTRMAKHPLARALRVDKMTLAALEATLRLWLLGRENEVPVHRMLVQPLETLRRRAAFWSVKLGDREVATRLLEAESAAGGGSLPGRGLPTVLLGIEGPASRLLAALRKGRPPVLARVEAGLCCVDPRTVLQAEDETLVDAIEAAVASVDLKPRGTST
jgi:L-seryl-tRNA(Ser) seleniumtransferase